MAVRILLVGNGGREHALAYKLAQSPLVDHIFAVPGNGGTAIEQKTSNITSVKQDDFPALLSFALDNAINLLVPGPEAPLVDGIVDYFNQHGPARIAVFGPSKAAAQMEGSKAFAKAFMASNNIPTALSATFSNFEAGRAYLEAHRDARLVIKADGLAAGKGVIMPQSHDEAVDALHATMVTREFGAAGDQVVIEEFLDGEEISILSFTDGYTVRSLPAAQDHKRVGDGDTGKNTGGMGCYAPTQIAGPALMQQIHDTALQPTIDGMRRAGFPMVGCLFTGFMLTKAGPKVLEYNVRFGDPESQTLLPLLETDLAEILLACTRHTLDSLTLSVKPLSSVTVVVAAGGYPDSYAKGTLMTLSAPPADSYLFHAGTALAQDGTITTSGGRVIACTAQAPTIREAVAAAYAALEKSISFDRMHYRRDIAARELHRLPTTTAASTDSEKPETYAAAGVSIDAGNELVKRIKPLVKATARPGADASIGGFGGLFSLAGAGYPSTSPRLVFGIDGIGTKLLLAQAVRDYSTVGTDLVAMNVNDLIVQGAEPLAFLDYYATGHLDVDNASSFVAGVANGCIAAGCALVGGETAEMAGLYTGDDFDAAGCAIGALPADATVLPDTTAMNAGDVLLGLASSGPHSNGYSLVRRLVAKSGLGWDAAAPWAPGETVGRALLTPTRIYVKPLLKTLAGVPGAVKGMAHITGGGITDNVPRMLPDGLAAHVHMDKWTLPSVFAWFREVGRMEDAEMVRTFNCGVGMVLVVARESVAGVRQVLEAEGETVFEMGELVTRPEGNEGVVYSGLDSWMK